MAETFYHTLPNGIRVVHCLTASEVVYMGVMVGTGTRDEKPEENGMAHYIEHCVFKGTHHHTSRQLINSIEGVGGEVNAYTTKEETTFYAATTADHVASTLRLLAEMVTEPAFPKAETDKECMVIYDEIESYNDSPSELIYDDFENLLFRNHSLAMPILGTKKTLRHISSKPELAIDWLHKQYKPSRMVVFFQGNIATERVFRLAEKEFAGYPVVENTRMRMFVPENKAATVTYKKHTHQQHVMLGTQAYPLGDVRQLPLYLLNNILGGGSLSSRLNLSLREQRGLVYTIESTYTPLSDTGYWCIYFACEQEEYEQCMALVRKELTYMAEHPLTEAALHRALVQLRGQMAIAAENQENNALAMAKSVLYFGTAPTWQETYAKVARTTPAILQSIAQDLFAPPRLSTLIYE